MAAIYDMVERFGGYFAANLAVPMIVVFITAWLSARFAIRQFRSQSWWERKWTEYTELIKHLHELKRYCAKGLLFLDIGENIPADDRRQWKEGLITSADLLCEKADRCELLLSKEASHALRSFLVDIKQCVPGQTSDSLNIIVKSIDTFRTKLIKSARKELRS
jgi:hypothetical protein